MPVNRSTAVSNHSDLLARASHWLQVELDDGSAKRQAELVEERLKILAANVVTPAAAGVIATLLGAPAIAIVATAMMLIGLISVKLNPQSQARQAASCRHHIWGILVGAGFFRLMCDWSNSTSPFGLPSLMGAHTSKLVVMMGTEIMPALLYVTLVMFPLLYVRAVVEQYKATRSHSDHHRDIALAGRYRKARRY